MYAYIVLRERGLANRRFMGSQNGRSAEPGVVKMVIVAALVTPICKNGHCGLQNGHSPEPGGPKWAFNRARGVEMVVQERESLVRSNSQILRSWGFGPRPCRPAAGAATRRPKTGFWS